MEWSIETLGAALAIGGPAFAWVVASVSRAITYRREQNQREWERLNHLVQVLYNKDGTYGAWAQLTAVYEMEDLRRRGPVVKRILEQSAAFWRSHGHSIELVKTIETTAARL